MPANENKKGPQNTPSKVASLDVFVGSGSELGAQKALAKAAVAIWAAGGMVGISQVGGRGGSLRARARGPLVGLVGVGAGHFSTSLSGRPAIVQGRPQTETLTSPF